MSLGCGDCYTGSGKFNDLLGRDLTLIKVLPKILVPTTSGSGVKLVRRWYLLISRPDLKFGLHNQCLIADAAIVDPQLVLSLPPSPTADGWLDAFIHSVEAILATKATPMSDAVALSISLDMGQSQGSFSAGDGYLCETAGGPGQYDGRYGIYLGRLGAIHALAYPLNIDCV